MPTMATSGQAEDASLCIASKYASNATSPKKRRSKSCWHSSEATATNNPDIQTESIHRPDYHEKGQPGYRQNTTTYTYQCEPTPRRTIASRLFLFRTDSEKNFQPNHSSPNGHENPNRNCPVAGLFDCRLVAAVAGFCKTRRQTRCRQADETGTESDMNGMNYLQTLS